MELVKSELIRFQIRHAQFGTVGVRELDLEEPVVSDEDDVIVCCRIEFVGGVLRDSGISSGMESGQEDNENQVCGPCEHTYRLTATCTNPCRVAPHGPSQAPAEH